MTEIRTYEDVEAFHAAEGWGCKFCGQLTSPSWWDGSGDTYCESCKTELKAEVGGRWTKLPNRQPGQAPATWEHDPSGFGFEYAKNTAAEYARLHEAAAAPLEAECTCGLTSCYGCRRRLIDETAQKIHDREVRICTGMAGFDVEQHAQRMADQYRTGAINKLALEFAN